MDLERLRAEFTSHEPDRHRNYLMVPREGQVYAAGSGVPIAGAARIRQSEGGLWAVGEPTGPAPIDYMGVYLTLDEYFGTDVGVDDLDVLVEFFIGEASQPDMLVALAILNRAVNDDDLRRRVQAEFSAFLQPATRERFENLISRGGQAQRWFIARQPVLMALREVLSRDPVTEPRGGLPPLVAALILTHALAMGLNAQRADDDGRTLGGFPASLGMEIICNEAFHESDDVYALIDRHVRLWRDFGARVSAPSPRKPPVELLEEASGLDLMTILAAGFGLYAHVRNWDGQGPFPSSKPITPGLAEANDRLLTLFARTPEEFRAQMERPRSTWDLLPFQETPVLDLGHGLVVLDDGFLLDRVTTGLYWVVHDHEKSAREADRHRWTQVYGDMVELQIEDSVDHLGLVSLGTGPSVYTEEQLAEAYRGKIADRVVDRGDTFLLIEIVSGRLTIASRIDGDVDAFEADTEKLVMKKVRQLDGAGASLLEDGGAALTGLVRDIPVRILPVVVVAGGFGGYPVNPVSVNCVHELIRSEGLLADGRFDSLCIIDAGEVELLEGLSERGYSPVGLLREWQESSLWRMPFVNWVLSRLGPGGPRFRPSRMATHVENVFRELEGVYGFRETPE